MAAIELLHQIRDEAAEGGKDERVVVRTWRTKRLRILVLRRGNMAVHGPERVILVYEAGRHCREQGKKRKRLKCQ